MRVLVVGARLTGGFRLFDCVKRHLVRGPASVPPAKSCHTFLVVMKEIYLTAPSEHIVDFLEAH